MKNIIILNLILLTIASPIAASIYWLRLGKEGSVWVENKYVRAPRAEAEEFFSHCVSVKYDNSKTYKWIQVREITRTRDTFPFFTDNIVNVGSVAIIEN